MPQQPLNELGTTPAKINTNGSKGSAPPPAPAAAMFVLVHCAGTENNTPRTNQAAQEPSTDRPGIARRLRRAQRFLDQPEQFQGKVRVRLVREVSPSSLRKKHGVRERKLPPEPGYPEIQPTLGYPCFSVSLICTK